jgi:hypothetical protein
MLRAAARDCCHKPRKRTGLAGFHAILLRAPDRLDPPKTQQQRQTTALPLD